jgi:hypothetical protein
LVPLGFAMGMPFPTGLRALASSPVPEFPAEGKAELPGSAVEWAWAMNAGSSVLGSVLAMVIAIQFGLNVTLACGAAAYLIAALLLTTLHPRLSRYKATRTVCYHSGIRFFWGATAENVAMTFLGRVSA